MKRAFSALFLLCLCLLSACSRQTEQERFLSLRADYLAGERELTARVLADYGDRLCAFRLSYRGDGERGTLTVLEPELIAGIGAELNAGESVKLSSDGVICDTGALFGDGATPLQALPLILRAVREGFVTGLYQESLDGEELLAAQIDRTPAGDDEKTIYTVWFAPESGSIRRAEISLDGVVVLTADFDSETKEG